MSTITIGVDLAKSVFSVCEMNGAGHVLRRRDLKRDAFAVWLAQVPAGTVVAMEACSGAHHWGRRCLEYGLQPRLMAAQFVTPFRKSRTAKNDRNDAEAIATAARQGNMRFVPVKTVDQQVRLSCHRVREGYKVEGLSISNRLRGLLAEFGIVVAKSDQALRLALADLDQQTALPPEMRELLRDLSAHWAKVRTAGEALCTAAHHHRDRCDHCRCRNRHTRRSQGISERPTGERVARTRTDTTFQWRACSPWRDKLSRRWLSAHASDPGRPQQPAASQSGRRGKVHARTDLDTPVGQSDALRQSAGGHRQQACPAAVGDAGP